MQNSNEFCPVLFIPHGGGPLPLLGDLNHQTLVGFLKEITPALAFLPQFINSEKPFIPQSLIFGSTFLMLAILSVLFYSLLASYTGQQMRLSLIHRWTNRIGGCLLIGAGGMIAFN